MLAQLFCRYFDRKACALISLALILAIPTIASAQRGAVSAPQRSAQKRVSKKSVKKTRSESEREREREKAKRGVKIDEASNAAAQQGPTVKPEMTFLGESESLATLARRPQK